MPIDWSTGFCRRKGSLSLSRADNQARRLKSNHAARTRAIRRVLPVRIQITEQIEASFPTAILTLLNQPVDVQIVARQVKKQFSKAPRRRSTLLEYSTKPRMLYTVAPVV